ncbi:core-2 i-branching beta--n-acetylglucosaminyltransferase family protein [Stylonychia lemnae]|uniref:Core-2 i-branching beta--n-acetylglucosaminyltransferase family protein n=1 Tax=Stylonychia lemnae TaxID=5949 RepID=A0A078ANH8_STYLE|nr:core-2 i-branching beta--n-acetylglucosaminyltransferase family protein [Stylonychia lemnae]|eukprot:CDW83890.1 core-2 i-branching beta--n-acetylglucosaminyltransferase family protein [Stylonychia lemnae]
MESVNRTLFNLAMAIQFIFIFCLFSSANRYVSINKIENMCYFLDCQLSNQLAVKAGEGLGIKDSKQHPKIAFLFLVVDKVNNPQVWDTFFQNADARKYSVYFHSKNKDVDSLNFRSVNQHIHIETIPTEWGGIGLWLAMSSLLNNSFVDQGNQRFVFLSQACIPLYSFNELYEMLLRQGNSMIEIPQSGDGIFPRYNYLRRYAREDQILKHCQWLILNRIHTGMLVQEHERAKRFLLEEIEYGTPNVYFQDEAVIGTMLYKLGQRNMITHQCVTYTKWDPPTSASPIQYQRVDKTLVQTARVGGCLFLRKVGPDAEIIDDYLQLIRNRKSITNS